MPSESPFSDDFRLIWKKAVDLPLSEQLEFHRRYGEHLGLGPGHPTKTDEQRDRVRLALNEMRRAAEHLHLADGVAPKSHEYEQAAKALGLSLSRGKVERAFGGWRWAKYQYLGGKPLPTPAQAALTSATLGQVRVGADYIGNLEVWLRTVPASKTKPVYAKFMRRFNDSVDEGQAPLVDATTIASSSASVGMQPSGSPTVSWTSRRSSGAQRRKRCLARARYPSSA